MISIPYDKLKSFRKAFQHHKMNIAGCNVLFQTMKMLNGRHDLVDRKSYEEIFLVPLSDIELVTPPIESFNPIHGENGKMFIINRNVDEYIEISKRITIQLIEDTLGPTSALVVLLKTHPEDLSKVHDDLFIYFCLYKYLDQIDMIRIDNFSNYTEVIEYIVKNITLDDWKKYLVTKKVNEEKYAKKCEDLIFNPDIAATYKFYMNNEDETVPKLDVVNLIMRLVSNQVTKDDMIIILGVYLTISFAMADFNNKKVDESPCSKYVRDVLCKL